MAWTRIEHHRLIQKVVEDHDNKRKHPCAALGIHWRLSKILKTSNKNVWSNVFWYVKVCIFWKCIQYTIHWDKAEILKNKRSENALFLLWRGPTHHSFTFNLWLLYDLKHKVRLSKIVGGIFRFRFRLIFIKFYIFV